MNNIKEQCPIVGGNTSHAFRLRNHIIFQLFYELFFIRLLFYIFIFGCFLFQFSIIF